MTKYTMKKPFWPLVIFTSLLVLSKSAEAYLDEESGFLLVPSLFFSVCMFIWMIQFYCLVCTGCIVWTIPVFYFKYKFNEIDELIGCCINSKDHVSLMNAISQHHSIALQVNAMNDVYKYIVFVLYYIGSPALIMLVFMGQIDETIAIARPVCALIVLSVFFVVFFLNLISAQISHSAAKPRNSLITHLSDKQMSIGIRIEISEFIVKLSRNDIGIYCWNIFLMNNYAFYQYITGCVCTYILICNLYNGI